MPRYFREHILYLLPCIPQQFSLRSILPIKARWISDVEYLTRQASKQGTQDNSCGCYYLVILVAESMGPLLGSQEGRHGAVLHHRQDQGGPQGRRQVHHHLNGIGRGTKELRVFPAEVLTAGQCQRRRDANIALLEPSKPLLAFRLFLAVGRSNFPARGVSKSQIKSS